MLIIGLTGGIGSGKSTVADAFAALGIPIIDADCIAKTLLEPHTPAVEQIIQHFGSDFLDTNGHVNRAKLRQTIFTDPCAREWLECLLHPLILKEIQRQIAKITLSSSPSSPYGIVVIPLLLEKKHLLPPEIQRIAVVDCSPELQIQRVQTRDHLTREQIIAIMQTQQTREQRLASADDIVSNHADLASLLQQVETLHQSYLSIASNASTQK